MKPTYIGIAIACLYMVFKMVLFFAGIQNDVLPGKTWLILMALVLIGIFFSINYYVRTSDTYDWMTAFKKGLTSSLTASVIIGLLIFVYYKWIDPGYLENLAIFDYNRMKGLIKQEDMPRYVERQKEMFNSKTFAVMTVSIVNIVGLIGSLVLGMMGRLTLRKA